MDSSLADRYLLAMAAAVNNAQKSVITEMVVCSVEVLWYIRGTDGRGAATKLSRLARLGYLGTKSSDYRLRLPEQRTPCQSVPIGAFGCWMRVTDGQLTQGWIDLEKLLKCFK